MVNNKNTVDSLRSVEPYRSLTCLALFSSLLLSACSEPSGEPPQSPPAQVAAVAPAQPDPFALDFDFYREAVEPIFLRPRGGFVNPETACITCHAGPAATPMRLETPQEENGNLSWTEEQSRRNLQVVARLVNPAQPEASRLLLAPLSQLAGGSRHSGGNFWDGAENSEYRAIEAWIRTGDASVNPPPETELDFEFFRNCVQPVFINPVENMLPCTECHGGEFAIPLSPGQSYWTEEQSRQSFEDLLYLIDPGYPENTRFLHKPLHPNAGGDLMHNGGRRWQSADDPERLALADWVRGEAQGSSCPPALQFSQAPAN